MAVQDKQTEPIGRFRLLLLGDFQAHRDGASLDAQRWPHSAATLLKLLAVARGHRRSRDETMDILWPDATPGAAASNLRSAVHLLRRVLGPGDPSPVLYDRGWIEMNPAYAWEIDLDRFDALMEGARDEGEALTAALVLYRGEPLVEDRYEDWARPTRERVRRQWREGSILLAQHHTQMGNSEDSIQLLQAVLEDDPYDEEALRALLAALARQGRRADALRHYRQFANRLREEMGLEPEASTRVLLDDISGARGAEAPLETVGDGAGDSASATSSPVLAEAAGQPRPLERARDDELTFLQHQGTQVFTFLVADIRGYTRFTLQHGDEAAGRLTAKFARIAREITEVCEGTLLELRGDEVLSIFPSVRQALRAAARLQARCREESGAAPSLPLTIGVGLDAGEAVPVEHGLRGAALNLAARLCALAGPGEILLTETVATLARRVDGLSYRPRGPVDLKGFDEPVTVIALESSEKLAPHHSAIGPDAASVSPPPVAGFLGAVPPTTLVGRESEIRRLSNVLASVREGRGCLVLMSGEAGVGKTRLAQEVTSIAEGQGFVSATGRCYEQRSGVPFYPFLEMLPALFERAPQSLQMESRRRWPDLGRLLPLQLSRETPGENTGTQEQETLFRAITGFLLALTSTAPLALLLDDLQWADTTSLELLQHLARHTRATPVFLLGTYRDMPIDWSHPLEAARRMLHREHLVEGLRVSRLDSDGTADLVRTSLGSPASPTLTDMIHRYASGNPFFTHELVRALVERGDVYRADDRWELRATQIAVPDTVRSTVGERLTRLDQTAREILQHASVLGATFTFTDLVLMNRFAARFSEDDVETALERAVHARLLVEAGADGYTFSHALVQHVMYSDLTSLRRRRLHRLAGEALARLPASQAAKRASEIAWHFSEGGDASEAIAFMLRAGEEAERVFAHVEAERLYHNALDMVSAGDSATFDIAMEAELHWRLGRVMKNMARYDEALQMLETADAKYATIGKTGERLGVAAEIGAVHFATGALRDGINRIEELLAVIDASETSAAGTAQLYIPLAHLYMATGESQASLTAAERAVSLAEESGEDRVRAQAQAIRGDALRLLLQEDEALRVLQDAAEHARSIGDADGEFLALDAIAELLVDRGELRKSERYRWQAIDLVERVGDPAKIAWERTSLGFLMFCLGDWTAARREIEQALATVHPLPPSRVTAYALIRLGTCDLGSGRWDDARHHLEAGTALSETHGIHAVELIGHALLAELDLLTGQPDTALQRLERQLARQDVPDWSLAALSALHAWTYLLLGGAERARDIAQRSVDSARAARCQLAVLDALRVAGMTHTGQEAWESAEAAFTEALNLALRMPFPYAAARTMHAWGQMELKRGRGAAATRHLHRAGDIFRDLGANWDAERCAVDEEQAAQIAQVH